MDERFCVPVDLPRLDDVSENEILKFVGSNSDRFIGWSFNNNYVSSSKPKSYIGFNNLRITDQLETTFFKSILEKNNIHLDYNDLLFALQRSKTVIYPHTDPGRTATLQYLIKGKAVTRFYSTDNFVPDVSYARSKLKLEAEFVIPPHTWYLYNNSAIHAAEQIEGERVQLAVVLTYKFENFEQARLNLGKVIK